MFSVLALAVLLSQVGFATDLKARSQTAADAAALAGELNVKQQLLALMATTGEGVTPDAINWTLVDAAAERYAEQNGGHIVSSDHSGFDYRVIVKSNKAMDGKTAKQIGEEGRQAETRSRATMVEVFSLSNLGGGILGPGGGATGGDNHIPADQLELIEKKAGVKLLPDSALVTDGGSGNGGSPDVADLTMPMKVAIARAEHLLGHPLPLSSGFRTYADQVSACQVAKICATPGTSMHEFGMAIDVSPYSDLAALLETKGDYIGLCHPVVGDPVHFSQLGDVECNRSGNAASGAAPPGGSGGFGVGGFDVHLVDYDNPPQLGFPGLSGAPMPPTLSQIQVAQIIASVGKQLGVDCKVMLSAFETAAVESGFQNLDYGDRDSLGVFQQRASWGSAASRLNVADSATRYFLRAIAEERGDPGEPAWLVAANVQRPAEQFRYKYGVDPWLSQAIDLLHRVGVDCGG